MARMAILDGEPETNPAILAGIELTHASLELLDVLPAPGVALMDPPTCGDPECEGCREADEPNSVVSLAFLTVDGGSVQIHLPKDAAAHLAITVSTLLREVDPDTLMQAADCLASSELVPEIIRRYKSGGE